MEEISEVLKNHLPIINHLRNNEINKYTNIKFELLNGLSNSIYKVSVYEKEDIILTEFVYRIFGKISDLLDRKLETFIINSLPGFTPGIYDTDHETYRLEEYINDAEELTYDSLLEKEIIDKILRILSAYSLIMGLYNYSVLEENNKYYLKLDLNNVEVESNVFDMCMGKMLKKAKNNFTSFSDIVDSKINYYIDNYEYYFMSVFPKNSYLILNHNDIHRLNILIKSNKDLILLDHEYASLNLIGNDIVNYLIESNFDYTKKEYPFYSFNNNINFKSYHEILKDYLNYFEISHSQDFKKDSDMKKFKKLYKYKHLLKIICIISLFWFLYCVIYFNKDKVLSKEHFSFELHALDRIYIFEKAYLELKNIK